MFLAFMPLHILMCDEVLLCFIVWIGIIQNSNLISIQSNLRIAKILWKNRKEFNPENGFGAKIFFSRVGQVGPA
jgi:hypothetical protein